MCTEGSGKENINHWTSAMTSIIFEVAQKLLNFGLLGYLCNLEDRLLLVQQQQS
jgi:hypothetical protein